MAILISAPPPQRKDRQTETKDITRDKKKHFMIKESVHQEDINNHECVCA